MLAAIGRAEVGVVRRPRVAILSTGDEIVAPGHPLPPGSVYDSNATVLADAVRELGGEPVVLGIVGDDEAALSAALDRGLAEGDVVLLSGGTSKGAGDLSYRALASREPGVVVHGVALKPGKPVCLGAVGRTPVAILPGFPTSATFTFHEFVAPVLRRLGGLRADPRELIRARLPSRFNSEIGRTEYVLVGLVDGPEGPIAYPMGKGSGSVTAFGRADGFIAISREREHLARGESVEVVPLGRGIVPADLVSIGSHCPGARLPPQPAQRRRDHGEDALGRLAGRAFCRGRGECDVAGLHLLDPASGEYNRPFLPDGVRWLPGYGRMQGLVSRPGNDRFAGEDVAEVVARAVGLPDCFMVNRNRGSGTRILIDGLLAGGRPTGYAVEARSHNAVAAAVAQGRADWGLAIGPVSAAYGLAFLPYREEEYDFAIPASRWDRPAVAAFRELLGTPVVGQKLRSMGLSPREGIAR